VSYRLTSAAAVLAFLVATASAAPSALAAGKNGTVTVTDRMIDVSGTLSVSSAQKIAKRMQKMDTQANAPIMLAISATRGSAQGVMLLRDSIQQLNSPVVGMVITQVHGAGAAAAMFTDMVVVYPSAGFVFTDVEYEGVRKPKKPSKDDKAKKEEPTAEEKLLQQARTGYLDRFWAALAKRVKMKPADLASKIAAGGFVITAEDALKTKIAHRRADRIRYVKLNKMKESYKVTTSQRKTRTGSPLLKDGGNTKK